MRMSSCNASLYIVRQAGIILAKGLFKWSVLEVEIASSRSNSSPTKVAVHLRNVMCKKTSASGHKALWNREYVGWSVNNAETSHSH